MMKVKPDLAARIYDLAVPAMTPYGALSEDVQKKAIEHVVKQMNLKEPPDLKKILSSHHWKSLAVNWRRRVGKRNPRNLSAARSSFTI